MSTCSEFKFLSALVWEAIEISWQYYRPTTQGLSEPSITDGLLLGLHKKSGIVVYVPSEIKTGADMELVIAGPKTAMYFNVQAKKLYRDANYYSMNRNNNNGYQTNVLCARKYFFPIYLFYNHYRPTQSNTHRHRLADKGCTIACGHSVRRIINPGIAGRNVISFDQLAYLQKPWETLVCPSQNTTSPRTLDSIAYAAARSLVSIDKNPVDVPVPRPRPLSGDYKRLVDNARGDDLAEAYDFTGPVIIVFRDD